MWIWIRYPNLEPDLHSEKKENNSLSSFRTFFILFEKIFWKMEFFFKNYFKKLPVVLKKLQCNGNRMTVGSDPDPN